MLGFMPDYGTKIKKVEQGYVWQARTKYGSASGFALMYTDARKNAYDALKQIGAPQ